MKPKIHFSLNAREWLINLQGYRDRLKAVAPAIPADQIVIRELSDIFERILEMSQDLILENANPSIIVESVIQETLPKIVDLIEVLESLRNRESPICITRSRKKRNGDVGIQFDEETKSAILNSRLLADELKNLDDCVPSEWYEKYCVLSDFLEETQNSLLDGLKLTGEVHTAIQLGMTRTCGLLLDLKKQKQLDGPG